MSSANKLEMSIMCSDGEFNFETYVVPDIPLELKVKMWINHVMVTIFAVQTGKR